MDRGECAGAFCRRRSRVLERVWWPISGNFWWFGRGVVVVQVSASQDAGTSLFHEFSPKVAMIDRSERLILPYNFFVRIFPFILPPHSSWLAVLSSWRNGFPFTVESVKVAMHQREVVWPDALYDMLFHSHVFRDGAIKHRQFGAFRNLCVFGSDSNQSTTIEWI